VQDRDSRFVVAWATGALSEALIEQAVTTSVQRTHQRELHWFSDGWQGYRSILERAYRKRVLTGRRGRPRLVVPESVTLMQTVKHRDEHPTDCATSYISSIDPEKDLLTFFLLCPILTL